MFDEWYSTAKHKGAHLGYDPSLLLESHAYVLAVMGHEWIDNNAAEVDKSRRLSSLHPLFTSLRSGRDMDIALIPELAEYLRLFQNDPKFASAVDNLRAPKKFYPALFELAMAYRWKQSGASVSLEPEVPHGEADFMAYLRERYIVECSNILTTLPSRTMEALMETTRNRVYKFPFLTAIEVTITSEQPTGFLDALQSAVKSVINAFHKSQTEVIATEEFGTIRMYRLDAYAEGAGPWDMTAEGFDKDMLGGDTIRLKLPPPPSDAPERIARKLHEEAEQLAGATDRRAILLDISGLTLDPRRIDRKRTYAFIESEIQRYPKIVAVWLCSRGFKNNRWFYRVRKFYNKGSTTLTNHFGLLAGDVLEE